MNKPELLAQLEQGRAEFVRVIEGLPEEAMVEAGVAGEWSVKDILAHVSRCEAELVALLYQAQQGRQPATAQFGETRVEEQNARWQREDRDRPLDRVLADFRGVRQQTIRRVQALPEGDLTDPQRYPWLGGKPLADWIASDSFEHEAEHAGQILAPGAASASFSELIQTGN